MCRNRIKIVWAFLAACAYLSASFSFFFFWEIEKKTIGTVLASWFHCKPKQIYHSWQEDKRYFCQSPYDKCNTLLKRYWAKITTNDFITWIIVLNQFLLFTRFLVEPRKMTVKCSGRTNEYFMCLTESEEKKKKHTFFIRLKSCQRETKNKNWREEKNGEQDKLGAKNENRKKSKL